MRLFRRPRQPKVDHFAALREATVLRLRADEIVREALAAREALYADPLAVMERLHGLRDEQDRVLERLREIARDVGAIA